MSTGMAPTTTPQYDLLVMEGREARENADNVQWTEGDLALQIEAMPADERPRDPETGAFVTDEDKALKRYAQDIDVNYSTLQNYRGTAAAWPPSRRRDEVSFATHAALNALEDRFDVIQPGMTSRDAQKLARSRQPSANNNWKPSWHELIGQVGDDLILAAKHLDKTEEAIHREPNQKFKDKAAKYAGWAQDLADRLHRIEAGDVQRDEAAAA